MIARFHRMQELLDDRPHLVRLGRLFCETVLVEVSGQEIYLSFRDGHLVSIVDGPGRKTVWRFGLRTDREAIDRFWQSLPAPGFHDIFGLVKIGRARIEGDILLLVRNLRFFKEFMALGRDSGAA